MCICLRAQFREYGVRYLEDVVQCAPLVRSALRDVVSLGVHVYAQRPPPPDTCQQLMSTKKKDGKLRSLYTSQAHYGTNQTQWTDKVAVNVTSEIRHSSTASQPVEAEERGTPL